ncbi:MAG: GGDEF domain-containing protein, partial [Actinomycetota bacterium]
ADRLDRAIRDTDTVGRWGGDEFVILLPGLDEASAIRSSAERITTMLSSTPVVGDTVMRASIGAAAFPRHGSTLDALLRTADAAMYAAKTTGVSYRVADADLARRANGLTEDGQPAADELVVTTNYVGPDRRAAAALGDELRGDDDTPQFIERSLESPPGDQVATPTAPAVEAPTAPADEVPTDAPAGAPSDAPVDR